MKKRPILPNSVNETFAKLSLFVISTRLPMPGTGGQAKGRNLNGLQSLRFLVVDTPRNDKIQRSQMISHAACWFGSNGSYVAKFDFTILRAIALYV